MPALRRKLNHRNIVLLETPSRETIGVATRSEGYRYLRWLGFIDVEQARVIPSPRPVKLLADAASPSDGLTSDWLALPPGKHVQGCLIAAGVFGIIENGHPRIV
jgi:hypothetical protein